MLTTINRNPHQWNSKIKNCWGAYPGVKNLKLEIWFTILPIKITM